MQLYEIQTFLSIARTRSITAAAHELFISQSTATHRLMALEKELGAALISRKRGQRSIELTPRGEAFIPIAERWSMLLNETQQWQRTPVMTDLNIGGHESINTYVLFPLLKDFIKNSTHSIRLRTRSKANRELYSLMSNKELDIAFVTEDYNMPSFPVKTLYKEDYVILYPKGRGFNDGDIVTPSQLNPESEIMLTWSKAFIAWHAEHFHITNTRQLVIDILPLAMEFLKDGQHWMTMPETIACVLGNEYNMDMLRYKEPPPQRICYKITSNNLSPTKKAIVNDLELKIDSYLGHHPALKEWFKDKYRDG